MTITANVTIDGLDEINTLLSKLPDVAFDQTRAIIGKSVLAIHNQTEARIGNGTPLYSRSGYLKRSLKTQLSGTSLATLSGSVYSDAIYAAIQEQGGTVEAKRAYMGLAGGPYLNIPADANKTPSGVMRFSARDVFAAGGYIVKLTSLKARYAVFLDDRPMFWLVKSVTIPARLGMVTEAEAEIPTMLGRLQTMELE